MTWSPEESSANRIALAAAMPEAKALAASAPSRAATLASSIRTVGLAQRV